MRRFCPTLARALRSASPSPTPLAPSPHCSGMLRSSLGSPCRPTTSWPGAAISCLRSERRRRRSARMAKPSRWRSRHSSSSMRMASRRRTSSRTSERSQPVRSGMGYEASGCCGHGAIRTLGIHRVTAQSALDIGSQRLPASEPAGQRPDSQGGSPTETPEPYLHHGAEARSAPMPPP